MGSRKFAKNIADSLDLPKEIVLNFPLVYFVGNEDITIQNHKGLIEYTQDILRINTTLGILRINGKNLYIEKITKEYIQAAGVIKGIEYEV